MAEETINPWTEENYNEFENFSGIKPFREWLERLKETFPIYEQDISQNLSTLSTARDESGNFISLRDRIHNAKTGIRPVVSDIKKPKTITYITNPSKKNTITLHKHLNDYTQSAKTQAVIHEVGVDELNKIEGQNFKKRLTEAKKYHKEFYPQFERANTGITDRVLDLEERIIDAETTKTTEENTNRRELNALRHQNIAKVIGVIGASSAGIISSGVLGAGAMDLVHKRHPNLKKYNEQKVKEYRSK